MNFTAHFFTQGGVHHAVALQGDLAGKRGADHHGFEMHAVITLHRYRGTGDTGHG